MQSVLRLLDILPNVHTLVLRLNNLDDKCMEELGDALRNNESLLFLDIGMNQITDQGLELFSQSIAGNTTLKQLKADTMPSLTRLSTPFLLDIARTTAITSIDVGYTQIPFEMLREINNACRLPLSERAIPLNSNAKSAAKIGM